MVKAIPIIIKGRGIKNKAAIANETIVTVSCLDTREVNNSEYGSELVSTSLRSASCPITKAVF